MKIDDPNPPFIRPPHGEPLDRTEAGRTKPDGTAAARRNDQLALSPDARLTRSAIETAESLPEIRRDVVEHMRALIDRGELGADANRLAEAMIDRWLTTP